MSAGIVYAVLVLIGMVACALALLPGQERLSVILGASVLTAATAVTVLLLLVHLIA